MGHTGYVQLYRRMLDQPWYQSPSARAVYLHLLLTARYKPGTWRRIPLQPGQTVTSIRALSAALGLSPAAVRAGLGQLRACGAVTLTRRPDGSVYTLAGYGALCGGPPDAPTLPLAAAAPPLDAVLPENLPAASAPSVDAGAPAFCPAAGPAGPRRGQTSPGQPSGDGPIVPGLSASAPPADAGASQPRPAAPPAGPRRGQNSPGQPSGNVRTASRLSAAAVSPVPSAALSDADRVDAQFCRVLAGLTQTKGG